ncbi:hypothetical protein [Butyrivibrio sp. WCE2006]|uniref:hypothetical protein n=1 Tax=Butyrivibrio sp. WCE2006 TaxID=1410611 RepID=UPI0005D2C3EE|nr:hypothetical protein [Butyrivibrio sp. WCE2006]
MKKAGNTIRGIIASILAAAFIVSGVPANSINVKAATKVDVSETTQVLNKKGNLVYKETGNNTVTITPGSFAKNVLSVTINDEDAKIKNIKCNKKLKYKRTYVSFDEQNDRVTYRFSFYTTAARRYKFKFSVDNQEYFAIINAATPVAKATFKGQELSTKPGFLGNSNYVTELAKGKFNVTMSNNYVLTSIQVGKYKNVTTGDITEPTLYWTTIQNNKKVVLSNERQVVVHDNKNTSENSMFATTIIRVNYKYVKSNTTGCVDYYFNRIVDTDN